MDITQRWLPKIVKDDTNFPFLIIDNWYTEEEEQLIWKELNFFTSFSKNIIPRSENQSDVASLNNVPLSKSYRFYLDTYFTEEGRKFSHILNYQYKFKMPSFHHLIKDTSAIGRLFPATNFNSSMITYYEDNDFYKEHFDSVLFTCLIWMVKEPKIFEGGELSFTEDETTINLRNNRMIIFPGYYKHKVNTIKFLENKNTLGYGKFTINHFFNIIS
jgi:hypothetical protein